MTFKKETEKIVSLQMKGLVHFYHPVILFERGTQYCCAAILWKGTNWKFGMVMVHGDACHVPKVSANNAFRKNCLLQFPIAWKHIYIQKEGISKHFGRKIVQLVWIVVTCLILKMELNMTLIVLMEFACIRQSVGS